MAGPASIPKFYDTENPPIPGGWRFWLDPDERRLPVQGASEQDVLHQIRSYQINNGNYQGDEPILTAMWTYWCSRQPSRCVAMVSAPATSSPAGEPGVPKEVWGPILWEALNWFAVKFDRFFFLEFVDQLKTGMIPCPDCRAHFVEIESADPAEACQTAYDACLWTWRVHNSVNRFLGKTEYPYSAAVAQYGFPTQ